MNPGYTTYNGVPRAGGFGGGFGGKMMGGGMGAGNGKFPFSTFLALGALQLLIGIAILGFGIADMVIHPGIWALGATDVWGPIIFIVTGGIGVAFSPIMMTNLKALKDAFMALSIISCLVAIAIACVVGVLHLYVYVMWNADAFYYIYLPVVILACLEFIIALTAAIICCLTPIQEPMPMRQQRPVYSAGSVIMPPQPQPMMAAPVVQQAPQVYTYPTSYNYAYPGAQAQQATYAYPTATTQTATPQVYQAAYSNAGYAQYPQAASVTGSIPAITYQ